MVYSDSGSKKSLILVIILILVVAGAVFFWRDQIGTLVSESLKGQVTAPSQLHTEELQTALSEKLGVNTNPLLLFALFYPEESIFASPGDQDYVINLGSIQALLREKNSTKPVAQIRQQLRQIVSDDPTLSAGETVQDLLADYGIDLDPAVIVDQLLESETLYPIAGHSVNISALQGLVKGQGVELSSEDAEDFLDAIYGGRLLADRPAAVSVPSPLPARTDDGQTRPTEVKVEDEKVNFAPLTTDEDRPLAPGQRAALRGLRLHSSAPFQPIANDQRPLTAVVDDIRIRHQQVERNARPIKRSKSVKEALNVVINKLFE